MSDKTGIEWTDATWNPVTGCTKVSPGCDHCYAETIAHRFAGTKAYPNGFEVTLHPERLDQPLRWKRPRRIFVNSMSDLFHDSVPDEFIVQVFDVMAQATRHTFQVLTKRHARMRSFVTKYTTGAFVEDLSKGPLVGVPKNVWLGVSTENQQWANIRIPALLETPAAVRFISAEPLLGRINLDSDWTHGCTQLDWVIVGGESGPRARPMHPNWARSLRDQCDAAGIAFHFKQRGEWTWNEPGWFSVPRQPYTDRVAIMHPAGMTAMTKSNSFNPFERGHDFWTTRIERVGKHAAGRELDGRTWDEYPVAASLPVAAGGD